MHLDQAAVEAIKNKGKGKGKRKASPAPEDKGPNAGAALRIITATCCTDHAPPPEAILEDQFIDSDGYQQYIARRQARSRAKKQSMSPTPQEL